MMRNKPNCECLGGLLGDLVEVDAQKEGCAYFRIKVEIDQRLVLCIGAQIRTKDCPDRWTYLKYEGLSSFFLDCGRLNRETR